MEWSVQNLGSVGEFVSSIAVVATLIYLAIQTKQTQKMIRGQTRQSWAEATQDALLRFADSDYIPVIQAKLLTAGFPDSEGAEVMAPSRGMWEPQCRAFGLDDVAVDLERLYDEVERLTGWQSSFTPK